MIIAPARASAVAIARQVGFLLSLSLGTVQTYPSTTGDYLNTDTVSGHNWNGKQHGKSILPKGALVQVQVPLSSGLGLIYLGVFNHLINWPPLPGALFRLLSLETTFLFAALCFLPCACRLPFSCWYALKLEH